MGAWHAVDITAGPYTWHITPETEAESGTILDGLRIQTGWDDSHPIQGAPEPWTARFGIVVDHINDVAALTIGAPVRILVHWLGEAGTLRDTVNEVAHAPLGYFYGRVSDLEATPRAAQPGVLVDVTCTDHLVDLAAITVGQGAWPAELLAHRIDRIFGEAELPVPTGHVLYGSLAAREAGPISALDAVRETLDQETSNQLRYYVAPNIELELSEDGTFTYPDTPSSTLPYQLGYSYKRPVLGTFDLPGRLTTLPTGVGMVIDPELFSGYGDTVIPASLANLDGVSWRKNRGTRVDKVHLTSPIGYYVRQQPNAVPVEFNQEVQINTPEGLRALGAFLLPDAAEDGWELGSVTLRDLPESMVSAVYCWPPTFAYQTPLFDPRRVVVLNGIKEGQDPNASGYYAGIPRNASLEFAGGQWRIVLELRPDVTRAYVVTPELIALGAVPPYLSCANLDASPLAATRPIDLDPALTAYDLRLARRL